MEPLDLNATLTDVVRLVRGDAQRRGMQVRAELDPQLPQVRGDHYEARRAVCRRTDAPGAGGGYFPGVRADFP